MGSIAGMWQTAEEEHSLREDLGVHPVWVRDLASSKWD
jgi:hypothetical protein